METPDASGTIYVSWPSKNIPHGGLMHTRIVKHTPDTEKILKELLQESRLASKQRHGWQMRAQPAPSASERAASLPYRPRTSRRRSLSTIRANVTADDDKWRPLKRGEDREALKERLRDALLGAASAQTVPAVLTPRPTSPTVCLPDTSDRIYELIEQIKERADWLREMESLGEGKPHRDIVRDQIAVRMRELDALYPAERKSHRSSDPASSERNTMGSRSIAEPNGRRSQMSSGVSAHRKASLRASAPSRALDENVAQLNALAISRRSSPDKF